MKTIPNDFEESDVVVMTNCDHSIEDGAEEILKNNKVAYEYTGWDFFGLVWWEKPKFYCLVKQYKNHVDTIEADSLEGIMSLVSERFGED